MSRLDYDHTSPFMPFYKEMEAASASLLCDVNEESPALFTGLPASYDWTENCSYLSGPSASYCIIDDHVHAFLHGDTAENFSQPTGLPFLKELTLVLPDEDELMDEPMDGDVDEAVEEIADEVTEEAAQESMTGDTDEPMADDEDQPPAEDEHELTDEHADESTEKIVDAPSEGPMAGPTNQIVEEDDAEATAVPLVTQAETCRLPAEADGSESMPGPSAIPEPSDPAVPTDTPEGYSAPPCTPSRDWTPSPRMNSVEIADSPCSSLPSLSSSRASTPLSSFSTCMTPAELKAPSAQVPATELGPWSEQDADAADGVVSEDESDDDDDDDKDDEYIPPSQRACVRAKKGRASRRAKPYEHDSPKRTTGRHPVSIRIRPPTSSASASSSSSSAPASYSPSSASSSSRSPKDPKKARNTTAGKARNASPRKPNRRFSGPRNKRYNITQEEWGRALETGKCPCPGCPYPTARPERRTDLKRHMSSHMQSEWVCVGVPLAMAEELDAASMGSGEVYVVNGQQMTGGCGRDLSRKDAYARHLRISDCCGSPHILEAVLALGRKK